jgi:hypothetical protein
VQLAPIDYLNPMLPAGLSRVSMPIVIATEAALAGYGCLVDDPKVVPVEIVRWPAQGSRPIDADTGDQGGTTEGVFVSEWQGDILYGRNEAVDGHYILAYATAPEAARTDHSEIPQRMLLWHANYHPDGGQLFFPLDRQPFYVPLALPGDDITPQRFTYASGSTAVRGSISIPTCGMKEYSALRVLSASSISRARCMPGCPSTSPANSAAFSRLRFS